VLRCKQTKEVSREQNLQHCCMRRFVVPLKLYSGDCASMDRSRRYERVCFSLCGAFEQKKKQNTPAKRPTKNPSQKKLNFNVRPPKSEKRDWSRVLLICVALTLATVPNRAYEKPPHWSKISTHCSSFFSWRHAAGPVES